MACLREEVESRSASKPRIAADAVQGYFAELHDKGRQARLVSRPAVAAAAPVAVQPASSMVSCVQNPVFSGVCVRCIHSRYCLQLKRCRGCFRISIAYSVKSRPVQKQGRFKSSNPE